MSGNPPKVNDSVNPLRIMSRGVLGSTDTPWVMVTTGSDPLQLYISVLALQQVQQDSSQHLHVTKASKLNIFRNSYICVPLCQTLMCFIRQHPGQTLHPMRCSSRKSKAAVDLRQGLFASVFFYLNLPDPSTHTFVLCSFILMYLALNPEKSI